MTIFFGLYIKYHDIVDEQQFAKILGLTYPNYKAIKNQKKKAIILKDIETEQNIIQQIESDENISKIDRKQIDYNEFIKLYNPYSKKITEEAFAEIIGISYYSYINLKSKKKFLTTSSINLQYEKMERIHHITRESRIYSYNEILEICKKYDISITEFLTFVHKRNLPNIIDEEIEILRTKGLYIGRKSIDKEILTKYSNEIIKYVNEKSVKIGNIYKVNMYSDDVASDTILDLISKRGDIFVNYEVEKGLTIIKYIASRIIENRYITYLRKKSKCKDENEFSNKDFNNPFGNQINEIEDSNEYDTINEKDSYNQCISLLQKFHNIGLSSSESINLVLQKLNLDKKTLLAYLEKAVIEKEQQKDIRKIDLVK